MEIDDLQSVQLSIKKKKAYCFAEVQITSVDGTSYVISALVIIYTNEKSNESLHIKKQEMLAQKKLKKPRKSSKVIQGA